MKKFLILIAILVWAISAQQAYSQFTSPDISEGFSHSVDKVTKSDGRNEWFIKWNYEAGFYSVETRNGLKVYHVSDRSNPISRMDRNWQNSIKGGFYSVDHVDGLKVYHVSDRNNPIPQMDRNWQNSISGS